MMAPGKTSPGSRAEAPRPATPARQTSPRPASGIRLFKQPRNRIRPILRSISCKRITDLPSNPLKQAS